MLARDFVAISFVIPLLESKISKMSKCSIL